MFVDYTGEKMKIYDKLTGKEIEVEVFVAILAASQITYAEVSEKIKDAFNKEFLQEDCYRDEKDSSLYKKLEVILPEETPEDLKRERIKNAIPLMIPTSQTANVLPLFLDMVPEEKKESVIKNLVNDIVVIHGAHLNTGILGTRYLLDVLTKYDYSELAYKLVTQTTYPGWGYMIQKGATTLWERWEYLVDAGMNSHNHTAFYSVDAWFYKVLTGINLDPVSPGFRYILIKPHPVGDLRYVSASLKTVRGTVSSSWIKSDRAFKLRVVIPFNSQAKINVPKMGWSRVRVKEGKKIIWKKGSFVEGAEGISFEGEEKNYIIFKIGSGLYSFVITPD